MENYRAKRPSGKLTADQDHIVWREISVLISSWEQAPLKTEDVKKCW